MMERKETKEKERDGKRNTKRKNQGNVERKVE